MKFILNLFGEWGLLGVFILIVLEYACFPIPSEVVLPFVGFIASLNEYSLVGVILMSVIMGYVGSLICYLGGYYGGSYLYNKIYNKFNKLQKGMDEANEKFTKYGNLSVFICRVIPLCRTYISFLAGIFKQSLFKYSIYSILGISVWNSILIVLGYFLMNNWQLVSFYYDKYKIILLIILVMVMFFLLIKSIKKRKKVKDINGD